MCRICGFTGISSSSIGKAGLIDMLKHIENRGTDEEGIYYNQYVGLGIRRLNIIDIENGRQPIHNERNDIQVVFNGEIYNYINLRQILRGKGHCFYTDSDTEVIVHLYEEYRERFVNYLNGTFAIAVWDGRNNKIIIASDRKGVKPLYYCIKDNTLIFASEIKSLLNCKLVKDVNPKVLGTCLQYKYTPGEQTMFKDIYKLRPGHMLSYEYNKITSLFF